MITIGNFYLRLVSRKTPSEEYLSFDVRRGVLSWQVVTGTGTKESW